MTSMILYSFVAWQQTQNQLRHNGKSVLSRDHSLIKFWNSAFWFSFLEAFNRVRTCLTEGTFFHSAKGYESVRFQKKYCLTPRSFANENSRADQYLRVNTHKDGTIYERVQMKTC